MKHETLEHPTQTSLRSKHAELLSDIELIAQRANAARRSPQEAAAGIVEAAEAAHLRILAAWRDSRGGNANNAFFDPLFKRLRRIIGSYRNDIIFLRAKARSLYSFLTQEYGMPEDHSQALAR